MLLDFTDFNGAARTLARDPAWRDIEAVVRGMPLPVKASREKGIKGTPIFDPIGCNAYLKAKLSKRRWKPNVQIASDVRVLGLGVDLLKHGIVCEAQFSNYPFLINNVVRTEILHRAGQRLGGEPIRALIVITKAMMFPASQSTLYYEQATGQIDMLVRHRLINLPVRVVKLHSPIGRQVKGCSIKYKGRTSRAIVQTCNSSYLLRQAGIRCEIREITRGRGKGVMR